VSATAQGPIRLTLYGRRDCHLCEQMEAALSGLRQELGFTVEVVDVDTSAALAARYGERVPVLVHGDTELCHYFLDRAAVVAHLGAAPRAAANATPFR
jgi:thioredoxin reductase (NADPH)